MAWISALSAEMIDSRFRMHPHPTQKHPVAFPWRSQQRCIRQLPSRINPCIHGFGVAEIDPATLKVAVPYDSKGKALINGVSTALQVGRKIYVGSFQGTRLVILPR